ncbi:hypothetical protein D2E28_00655 [Mycobacteroides abscessus]|nr:hypothetical protein D2E28_00655 [Mycobacteroides abscessus]
MHELAQDCVNQGGITNLHVITHPTSVGRNTAAVSAIAQVEWMVPCTPVIAETRGVGSTCRRRI